MDRRSFFKDFGRKSLGIAGSLTVLNQLQCKSLYTHHTTKNWVWIGPDTRSSDDQWHQRFERLREAGFHAVLPEIVTGQYAFFGDTRLPVKARWLERLIPIARAHDLEIHAWMVCMLCGYDSVMKDHPDWYNVNRLEQSSLTHPAYVDYYKFLCPSREGVHDFLKTTVHELSQYGLDGVHFDYIRYPDVILAQGLWEKYHIVQDKEYPQYDYCYCDTCRSKFKSLTGIDPLLDIEDPSTHRAWIDFRQNQITDLVNNTLIPEAKKYDKITTAAVFPNWKAVRQHWHVWKLDAVIPMLYNKFYLADAEWIKQECIKGLKLLEYHKNLYSGIMVDTPENMKTYVSKSLEGGAKGVSVFSFKDLKEEHLHAISPLLKG